MKLTKYKHACFTLEKDGQILVVDPGNFTTDFVAPHHVIGVIYTHQHADHYDPAVLEQIYAKNPDLIVIAPDDTAHLVGHGLPIHIAKPGQSMVCGNFNLQFFGGEHALIHQSVPRPQNISVLIDNTLYYPGDSLTTPNAAIDTLAIPAAAPWLKIGEAMDFLLTIKPRMAFPTHDAVASKAGQNLADRMLGNVAKTHGIEYQRLTAPVDIPEQ